MTPSAASITEYLFDSTAIALLVTDEAGRILDCNTAAARLLRASPSGLGGRPFAMLFPEISREAIESLILRPDLAGHPHEHSLYRSDGSIADILLRSLGTHPFAGGRPAIWWELRDRGAREWTSTLIGTIAAGARAADANARPSGKGHHPVSPDHHRPGTQRGDAQRGDARPGAAHRPGAPEPHHRFALMAEASRIFAEASMDLEMVMEVVSRSTAEWIGDLCVIRLLSEDRRWLRPVAIHHPDPEARELARSINSIFGQSAERGPGSVVLKTGQPLLMATLDIEQVRENASREYLMYLDRFGISSLLMVPLRVRGEVIGTLGVTRDLGSPHYTIEDQVLLQDLADRAAMALDNAMLYRASQEELEERTRAENRYRLVLRATNDAVWDWDLRTDHLWRSGSLQTLFGYAPEEIETTPAWWVERMHPDDRLNVERSVRLAIESGDEFWASEYRFRRGDGTYAHILDQGYIVRDEEGSAVRMMGAMSDITPRKEAEEALRTSELKFRSLIENIPDMVWTATSRGKVTYVSPNAQLMVGYSPEEIQSRGRSFLFELGHPDDARTFARAFNALFDEGKPLDLETRIRRKEGNYIWVSNRAAVVYTRDGERYVDIICSDITERKNAELDLQLFRTIIDQSNDEFVVIDPVSGRIIDGNTAAHERLGYTRSELLQVCVYDVDTEIANRDRWWRICADLRERGVLMTEGTHRCKDGRTYPVEINVKYITIDRRDFIVAVARDITERKRAEESLRRAYDVLVKRVEERTSEVTEMMSQLERTRSSQARFVAYASHDLRTPLTVVRAEIDLLRGRPEHDSSTRGALERIFYESKRLDRLANDLSLLASLDTVNPVESMRPANLAELVLECVGEAQEHAAQKDIAWDIQLGATPDVPSMEQALRRAVANILDNAVKYSPPQGTVRIEIDADSEFATVRITDMGEGISRDDLPYVFDRFYRSDPSRSTPGTGLGLSIVKSVVDAHGGMITVDSQPGNGTSLTMLLPV